MYDMRTSGNHIDLSSHVPNQDSGLHRSHDLSLPQSHRMQYTKDKKRYLDKFWRTEE
jgi:hypothetical protein